MSEQTPELPETREAPVERETTANVTATPGEAASPGESAPSAVEVTAEAAEDANASVVADSRRHTRRSFVVAAAGAAAGYGFYRWIGSRPQDEMQPKPLRDAFELNASLSKGVLQDHLLAPTYPLSRARDLRVNGVYGLKRELVPESWRLQLVGAASARSHAQYVPDVTAWEYRYRDAKTSEDAGHDTKIDPNIKSSAKMAPAEMVDGEVKREEHAGRMPRGREEAGESRNTLPPGTPGLLLTMADLARFPRHEFVTQFKCIEGWSEYVHWAGFRMADFLEEYPPEKGGGPGPMFVYMETPDGDYYTGYDLHVCRHPQTLLVTEMMGAPLTQYHGAPLRLHMPTKYGYKQIKRIGLIAYTSQRPDDYWTRLGYDWYAGL